jgi:hypothetical protein
MTLRNLNRLLLSVLLGGFVLSGCGSIEIPTSSSGCQSDEECGQGSVCIQQVCTTSAEDSDSDGLTNGVEAELGTDPGLTDTDGDGIDDKAEIPDLSAPLDSDGDGVIDALESSMGDTDGDCITDQYDTEDDSDTAVIKKLELCALEGVCASGDVKPKAECAPGTSVDDAPTWFCSYGGVVGYNPGPDDVCDGLDNDCDGAADEDFTLEDVTCGVGACAVTVTPTCQGGSIDDTCTPNDPAADDATCDGVDDDCDGAADEDFTLEDVTCGVGACAVTVTPTCQGGSIDDTCTPGDPGADDTTCDGVDDDCDEVTDEDFAGDETECGQGACVALGTITCVDGAEVDGCEPLIAASLNDTVCDGVDDDCDGETDEEYVGPDAFCGVGACKRSGSTVCFNGTPTLNCLPGAAAADDATCDGVDDDCDSEVDEDFEGATTTCGSGGCLTTGKVQCQDGVEIDDCVAGSGAVDDATCDGIDDDCDGETDEEYLSPTEPTSCGVGACASEGALSCWDGAVIDTCVVGTPGETDASCDNVDNDCNGETDEDYVAQQTICGTGSCEASGSTSCVDGETLDDCQPLEPAVDTDATCDGVDDNCNGATDEDFAAGVTTCGKGVCASEGDQTCQEGTVVDTCKIGEVAEGELDASCDGEDQDCDGATDEGFEPAETSCGDGVCLAIGESTCVDGVAGDSCEVGVPSGDDVDCNDVDQDCDGFVDEGFESEVVICGAGECAGSGVTSCTAGQIGDSCNEGEGLAIDASCDGKDNDCDDKFDEDYAPVEVNCGLGVCAATVMTTCVAGTKVSDCAPLDATDDIDATCNGLDDDCDGETDEGFVVEAVSCGKGVCEAQGNIICVAGIEEDTCVAGIPGPNDASCNGSDNDCDGVIDENFQTSETTCGAGQCAAGGERVCVDGDVVDTCAPLSGAQVDISCDGLDDDCDGDIDEDYVASQSNCGVGSCGSLGQKTCISGAENDTCEPGQPGESDATCDGADDDCDGATDEDHVVVETTCGVGACGSVGEMSCVGGATVNTCEPGTEAPSDVTCDGVDDNCDGQTDEGFVTETISCGTGACLATGTRTCSNGAPVDNCVEGTPAASDATCDATDDDCDGETDEEYVVTVDSCGGGACAAEGELICVGGEETSTCVEVEPGATDNDCDGVDDDCNGETDEGYVPVDFPCGEGECARVGQTFCQGGNVLNDCQPGSPAADDATCDGLDNDCSGATDEDYVSQTTSCGQGVCQASGATSCVSGQVQDSCQELPVTTGEDDSDCDGLDSDCDGETDEGYVVQEVTCGTGVCEDAGQIVCQAAPTLEVNTCEPLTSTASADYECNGLDDDCDGEADEDYVSVQTECGEGACLTTSMSVCLPGSESTAAGPSNNCFPPLPSTSELDQSCNGSDDDCDGGVDEGFVAENTSCGVGNCISQGATSCGADGIESDSCQPGSPTLASDGTLAPDGCGGGDSDCDESTDEDFVPVDVTCGSGTCEATITTSCGPNGDIQDSCTPLGEPSCENKACGDNGCGGSCGSCEGNETCTADFTCKCVPSCVNIGCGDDGCGGDCGTCPTLDSCQTAYCSSTGSCVYSDVLYWTPCEDGSPHTVGDFCFHGRCTGFHYDGFEPSEAVLSETFVDASRRVGGGIHAVYVSTGGVPILGSSWARAFLHRCEGDAACSIHLQGQAGSAQAVSPNYQHFGGGLPYEEQSVLTHTTDAGYETEGTLLQEAWLSDWDGDVPPITALASKAGSWVAGAYVSPEGLLRLYRCSQDEQFCELSGAPNGAKYGEPVRMRNAAGNPMLLVNSEEAGGPVIVVYTKDTGWSLVAEVANGVQALDFASVFIGNGNSIEVTVGRQGFIGTTTGEESQSLEIGDMGQYTQGKITFLSVARFEGTLVALGLYSSGEYVLAHAPWDNKVNIGASWSIHGTKVFVEEPTRVDMMQADNTHIYLLGSTMYGNVRGRAMHRAGALTDDVVLHETFDTPFALDAWQEFVSCPSTEWVWATTDSGELSASMSQGCSDPESIEEELELNGALLWTWAELDDHFTLTVNVIAQDDDGYGVVYALADEKTYYRVRLDQQRGFIRLERSLAGEVVVLGERTDVEVPVDTTTTITVERIGALHIVSVNGAVMFQAQDNVLQGGAVGFWTWAMHYASFLDIQVTRPSGL